MVHVPSIYDALHVPPELQSLVLASLLVLLIAALVRAGIARAAEGGIIPDERITLRNLLEVLLEGVASLGRSTIGENWARYMPLLGTMGFFILVSNLLGLVPGFGGPTSFIETNLAWALIAFVVSEAVGVIEHGPGYVKHFMPGPWWIAWFLLPIELFSHLVRIVSLTIRLTANMFADHTLLGVFLAFPFIGWIVPSAVMGLGVFVAFVQAFIFTFLTMIYIGLALEHAH
jgi:F-type H+-transporting ATPase subunit a